MISPSGLYKTAYQWGQSENNAWRSGKPVNFAYDAYCL